MIFYEEGLFLYLQYIDGISKEKGKCKVNKHAFNLHLTVNLYVQSSMILCESQ